MMKHNFIGQMIAAGILVVVAFFMLDPFRLSFSPPLMTVFSACAVICFGVLANFISHEEDVDERQIMHRLHAGRRAFLAGCAALVVALTLQAWWGSIDPWIVIALIAMVFTKIAVRVYSDINL